MVKNNSATGTNALTKSDSESNFPITFQPMPKRFMVWDKVGKQFLRKRLPDGIDMVFSIFELPLEIDCLDEEEKKQFIVCQSTNLFDARGIEIFEGSIIRDEDEGYFSVIENRDGEYYGVDPYTTEIIDVLSAMKLCSEVIGHILSSPKLLEEKV